MRAAAALHAEVDLQLRQPLHILLLECRFNFQRHQICRTVRHAPAAADTGRRLRQNCVLPRQRQNGVRVLQDRLLEIGHRNAHHRAAVDDLARLFLEAAAGLEHVAHPHPDRHEHVLRHTHRRAVDRHALFHQRQSRPAIARDGRDGRAVEDDRARVQREFPFLDDLVHHMVDEDLLAALRVDRGQRTDLHVLLLRHERLIVPDALGLVFLDAEDDLRHVQELLQQAAAADDVEVIVQHRARVARHIRLTLGTVDDDALDLVEILDRQLHHRREARAAEAHKAAGPHGVEEILHRLELRRMQPLPALVESVGFNFDVLHRAAHRVRHVADLFDRARDARVDRRGDEAARLADELAGLDVVADLDDRSGRRADVHRHRDHDRLRQRQLCRLHGRRVLVPRNVDAMQIFQVDSPFSFLPAPRRSRFKMSCAQSPVNRPVMSAESSSTGR